MDGHLPDDIDRRAEEFLKELIDLIELVANRTLNNAPIHLG